MREVTMAGWDFSWLRAAKTRVADGVTWVSGKPGLGEWFAYIDGHLCEVGVSYHRATRNGYSIRVGNGPEWSWGGERTFDRALREAARLARRHLTTTARGGDESR